MGLHVNVYRREHRHFKGNDATNGGISAKALDLCLVNVDGPSEPSDEAPAALLVPNNVFGDDIGRRMVKVVPAERLESGEYAPLQPKDRNGPMFGGNFAATSDSRFGDAVRALLGVQFYGAVPIHDRFEDWR